MAHGERLRHGRHRARAAQAVPDERHEPARRAAEQTLPLLSRETRDELGAYADGVNAWLARNELPEQYASVQVTEVAPWSALDSVLALKLLTFSLSFDLDWSKEFGPEFDAIMGDQQLARAKAILMAHNGTTENEAYQDLRRQAMERRISIEEVAKSIVLSEEHLRASPKRA